MDCGIPPWPQHRPAASVNTIATCGGLVETNAVHRHVGGVSAADSPDVRCLPTVAVGRDEPGLRGGGSWRWSSSRSASWAAGVVEVSTWSRADRLLRCGPFGEPRRRSRPWRWSRHRRWRYRTHPGGMRELPVPRHAEPRTDCETVEVGVGTTRGCISPSGGTQAPREVRGPLAHQCGGKCRADEVRARSGRLFPGLTTTRRAFRGVVGPATFRRRCRPSELS